MPSLGSLKAKVEAREAANPKIGYKAAMQLMIEKKVNEEIEKKKKDEKRRQTLKNKVENRKEAKEVKL